MTWQTHWAVKLIWKHQNLKVLTSSCWSRLTKGATRAQSSAVSVTWSFQQRKTWKATRLRHTNSNKRSKPTNYQTFQKEAWTRVFQVNSYKCQFCNGQFLVAKNLLDHMKLVTPGKDDYVGFMKICQVHVDKNQRCPMCRLSMTMEKFSRHWKVSFFSGILSLNCHSSPFQEAHMRPRKPCPHCGKVFRSSNLLRHMRQVHRGDPHPFLAP